MRAAMDAVRHRDEKQVMLKRVSTVMELEISMLVSSPRLRHNPRNHCVPLIEVIELPHDHDQKLMVMPLLRPFDQPRFQTFGEFVAFFTQICDVRSTHHLFVGVGGLTTLDSRVFNSCTNKILLTGMFFGCLYYKAVYGTISGTARQIASCLIQLGCTRTLPNGEPLSGELLGTAY
jgi:hypothetical protein